MSAINYREFAKLAGVTSTTILKRIRSKEILAGVGVQGNRLIFTIDTSIYLPSDHSGERRGRPRKIAKSA